MNDKTTLRRAMRARRRAFVAALDAPTLARATAALADAVVTRLDGARCIAGYIAMGGEPDALSILAAAHAAGAWVALPVVESREAPLRFLCWQPGDPLAEGPFGLFQPVPDAPLAEPDLILAPLVAFDRTMGRLGQGASHYDRAFAALPHARRIGLAWSVQEADGPLPADPWDVPLHAVATELEWIEP